MRRIGVTGGRNYHNMTVVEIVMFEHCKSGDVIVHGAARGADSLCARLANDMGWAVDPHPADWRAECRDTCPPNHRRVNAYGKSYCPMVGHYRNQEMLDGGLDLLIVFPGAKGTADMVNICKKAGVPIVLAMSSINA